MNGLRPILLVAFAFVGVFAAAWLEAPRRWLGAQFDVLPALVVVAALTSNLPTLGLLAVGGGVFLDALSANPLGVSILPLFATGCGLHRAQEVVLRDLPYAQVVLGVLATAAIILLKLVLLLSLGETPLIGWGSLWQFTVTCAWSAALTPLVFLLVDRVSGLLAYPTTEPPTFRPDREILRGRH
jgi:cell shape-determining protein MreD